jgi:hypothetical protein
VRVQPAYCAALLRELIRLLGECVLQVRTFQLQLVDLCELRETVRDAAHRCRQCCAHGAAPWALCAHLLAQLLGARVGCAEFVHQVRVLLRRHRRLAVERANTIWRGSYGGAQK